MKVIATIDCTGHGVPGAFMSILVHTILNNVFANNKCEDPAEMLNLVNKELLQVLQQNDNISESNDGMDISLCFIDQTKKEILYAGAYRPLFIISNNKLSVIDGTKSSIGGNNEYENSTFASSLIDYNEGDSFYIFSDGFVDQFGGENYKKFMVKRLKKLLEDVSNLNINEQKEMLLETFEKWKGENEQTDDVVMIGFKL